MVGPPPTGLPVRARRALCADGGPRAQPHRDRPGGAGPPRRGDRPPPGPARRYVDESAGRAVGDGSRRALRSADQPWESRCSPSRCSTRWSWAALLAVVRAVRSPDRRWTLAAGAIGGALTLTRANGVMVLVALAAGVWAARRDQQDDGPRPTRRAGARPPPLPNRTCRDACAASRCAMCATIPLIRSRWPPTTVCACSTSADCPAPASRPAPRGSARWPRRRGRLLLGAGAARPGRHDHAPRAGRPLVRVAGPRTVAGQHRVRDTETPRFRAPLDPFVILLASAALATAAERLRRRHDRRPGGGEVEGVGGGRHRPCGGTRCGAVPGCAAAGGRSGWVGVPVVLAHGTGYDAHPPITPRVYAGPLARVL